MYVNGNVVGVTVGTILNALAYEYASRRVFYADLSDASLGSTRLLAT